MFWPEKCSSDGSFGRCVLQQETWQANIEEMNLSNKPFRDIAERLLWHRTLLALEQRDYAERAGLNRSQYSNWESGGTRLSIDGALALRRTYGLSLDFMYEGSDDALSMSLRKAWLDRPNSGASKQSS
jgi:DNA-binding XRE family transcriptional regulator